MPNIPNVPGVPRLDNYGINDVILLIADAIIFAFSDIIAPWGIFRNGIPVIASDSTISFELKQDFSISDYPVEGGGFQSYNKVQLPSDIRISVAAGGSDAARQLFLSSIDAVMNTTDLYDIVTPETVYLGYNFSHRDFRRTAKNGVGLITVDLWMIEIRESSSATFQNTQQPPEAGVQGIGNVQPQAVAGTDPLRITVNKPAVQ